MLLYLEQAYVFDRESEDRPPLKLSPDARRKMEAYLGRDPDFQSPADDFLLAQTFFRNFWWLGLSPSADEEAYHLLIDIAPADAVNKLAVSFGIVLI